METCISVFFSFLVFFVLSYEQTFKEGSGA